MEKGTTMSDSVPFPMIEFILWTNCSNSCSFCWQKHINNPHTILTEEEKVHSIEAVMTQVLDPIETNKTYSQYDCLLVGGEIMDYSSFIKYKALNGLFHYLKERIDEGKLRYVYINTNLLYEDLDQLSYLLNLIPFDRLKFTVSYDIEGRFKSIEDRALFERNLETITYSFPQLNVVANIILTKQTCYAINTNEFSVKAFCERFKCKVNTIPYICLDKKLQPPDQGIFYAFDKIEEEIPGYIQSYIDNFDIKQKKILYEYDKTKGYIECTSEDNTCGHNINFTKVFGDPSCYICELKRVLIDGGQRSYWVTPDWNGGETATLATDAES